MNAFGFFLGRLAWQFGIRRERSRWNAVTRETQILSEAQDLLGRLAWPATGNIEDLTGEFWQLRDMDAQQAKLRDQSESLMAQIEEMKEKLLTIENRYEEMLGDLRAKKNQIMEQVATLNEEMEDLRSQDQAARQRFGSLKRKLDVLKRQEGEDLSDEIERTRQALHQLKIEHEENKVLIEKKEAEVHKVEATVQGVDEQIAAKREEMKLESADLVSEIGRFSKQVAEISAKIGALENSKAELAFQVGQYLSNNIDNRDTAVQNVLRDFRPIVGKIQSLRKSIQYNQRLARRSRI